MRWIWIDYISEFEKGDRLTAYKQLSFAEEFFHTPFEEDDDLGHAEPVMPSALIVEGMAQSAGLLVGATRDFEEKVVLAKVNRAAFHAEARPGDTLVFRTTIERLDDSGASTRGSVERRCPRAGATPSITLADIDLMFFHLDHNRAGIEFPENNFVFGRSFELIIRTSGFGHILDDR